MIEFDDDKRGVILQAGLTVFMAYGFKKTSMDDIARQANMSRPALYQVFKNKTDIFRAVSQELMKNAIVCARCAFDHGDDLESQLFRALDDSILSIHRFAEQSHHGPELMGINQEICRDIEQTWKSEMVATIAAGIDQSIAKGQTDLKRLPSKNVNSITIARMLMFTMEGMRETVISGTPVDAYVRELVTFIAFSLQPEQRTERA